MSNMTDPLPPVPLDGQTWPSFPSSWYQDATPSRPFYIPWQPVQQPSDPPVYTPPPYRPPVSPTGTSRRGR